MSRTLANILSWVGQPLLVPTAILMLMIQSNPYAFRVGNISELRSVQLCVSVFVCTALLPGISILMMKALGMIKSVHMEDKQDRIGPYIAGGIFYLWLLQNMYSGDHAPALFTQFVLGGTLSLFVSFFSNIFTKVSAHAAGMGGLVAMLAVLAFQWPIQNGMFSLGGIELSGLLLLALGIVLAGAVGTARLALGAHTPDQLWKGYLIGGSTIVLAVLLDI